MTFDPRPWSNRGINFFSFDKDSDRKKQWVVLYERAPVVFLWDSADSDRAPFSPCEASRWGRRAEGDGIGGWGGNGSGRGLVGVGRAGRRSAIVQASWVNARSAPPIPVQSPAHPLWHLSSNRISAKIKFFLRKVLISEIEHMWQWIVVNMLYGNNYFTNWHQCLDIQWYTPRVLLVISLLRSSS